MSVLGFNIYISSDYGMTVNVSGGMVSMYDGGEILWNNSYYIVISWRLKFSVDQTNIANLFKEAIKLSTASSFT